MYLKFSYFFHWIERKFIDRKTFCIYLFSIVIIYGYVTGQKFGKVCYLMKFNKIFIFKILKEKRVEKLFLIFMNVSSKYNVNICIEI